VSRFDPRDADPLRHVGTDEDLWDPQLGAWVPRQSALAAMLVALVIGIVAGVLLVFAISAIAGAVTAPRAAQSATGDATGSVRAEQLGAPSSAPPPSLSAARSVAVQTVGAPTPSPAAVSKHGPSPAITPKPTKRPVTEPPALDGGIASWCAPTPTQCQRWGGQAKLGAVHSFRWGDRPYRVRVCRQVGPAACVTVTVVSYCGCPDGRAIDLSPYAFGKLAPLSRGLVAVTVEELR
jgi:hypothetical protein